MLTSGLSLLINFCNRLWGCWLWFGVSGSRSWVIQIWIWFNGSFFSPLHMFGKFPEINRNYLQAVAFTMFKVFPDFLDSKDTILLVTFNDELDWNGGLGPQQSKRLCFWGCRLGCYKMNAKLYVKYSIEYRYLVLIRVSLRAANCAWPWLDIKKRNRLFGNCFARRILIDRCIRVDTQIGHDWTIDFLVKKQHDLYILIMIIKTPSASTC